MKAETKRPRAAERLLGIACYLGLAPLVRLFHTQSNHPFVRHHYLHAMAALSFLLMWLGFAFLLDATYWLALTWFPNFTGWPVYVTSTAWLLLAALVLMWFVLIVFAIIGSTRNVLLLRAWAARPGIGRFALFANVTGLALVSMIVLVAFHAVSLTARSRDGAAVYFLFDEGIPVPRAGYALGLYRVSLYAQRNWGAGSVVLDRLNQQTLRSALAHGKVVILATHGARGYVCTYYAAQNLCIGPSGDASATNGARSLRTCVLPYDHESRTRFEAGKWDRWDEMRVNSDLQLMYLFGCEAGKQAWSEHLAPARVIAYPRSSTVFDHALWFAVTGPGQLRRVR